ncbi:MAG: serine/threonine protein kinase [Phycisphaerales bacterium]|nr:MAG: serine/threonine protein kinase [Phycisphaerales bacterium]
MDTKLAGYRVTRQIGTGARSRILLAVELKSGKQVALKHVLRNSADDDPFLVQVEREYEITSKLDHPNLRRGYTLHRIRKRLQTKELVLVMEYVDGLSLEKARPNRLNTFLTIFKKVAAGLHAMHEAGYVHSDMKPTNVMIGKGGVVKIIDFGQASALDQRKERIQGTPDFIAPEQVRRMVLTRRTDVFNVGATMYWLLTSENYPTEIRGTDARGGIALTSPDNPIAPIELNDKIPLSLSKLVMECCNDNPTQRPADMKQLSARLDVVRKLWKKQRAAAHEQLRASKDSVVDEVTRVRKDDK